MNPQYDNEMDLQRIAEEAERARQPAGGNAVLDIYRLVLRALRKPLPADLPTDFTSEVMRRIAERERRTAHEDLVITGLLLLLIVVGVWLAYPHLLVGVGQLSAHLPFINGLAVQLQGQLAQVPWPMIGVAGVGIGAALMFETLFSRPLPRLI